MPQWFAALSKDLIVKNVFIPRIGIL